MKYGFISSNIAKILKKIRLFYIQYLLEAFWGQNIKHIIPKSAVNMPTIPRRCTLWMKAARRSTLTARNKSPVPARSGWWNELQQFKRTLWHTRGRQNKTKKKKDISSSSGPNMKLAVLNQRVLFPWRSSSCHKLLTQFKSLQSKQLICPSVSLLVL